MQVQTPVSQAPGSPLELNYDQVRSCFAFNRNLRPSFKVIPAKAPESLTKTPDAAPAAADETDADTVADMGMR